MQELNLAEPCNMSATTDPRLDVRSGSGGFVTREVIRFACFIRRPHRELAPAAARAIEQVIDAFPPPALSMFAIESGDWIEFDSNGLKAQVRDRLIGADGPINATAALSGNQANIPDVSLDYAGLALDRPAFRNGCCTLSFQVAATAAGTRPEPLLNLAASLARSLDCHAAYVDLALAGDQKRNQVLARRYRCLDISNPRCVARDLEGRLPGIYWKNFLGGPLVAALGGRQALEALLSPNARFEAGPRGELTVTLGDGPIRGDVNGREQSRLHDRVAFARLAREKGLLHVPRKIIYFEPEEGLDDEEAQEQWHLRYAEG